MFITADFMIKRLFPKELSLVNHCNLGPSRGPTPQSQPWPLCV